MDEARVNELGSTRDRATMTLYRSDGIDTDLRRAASRSPSRTTSAASSHIGPGTPSCPGVSPIRAWKLVCVKPGQTAVTLTPSLEYSAFAQRLNPMSHDLQAE